MTPGRRLTLAWLAVALAATALLGAALPRLRLGPGEPLPALNEGGELVLTPATATAGAGVSIRWAAVATQAVLGAFALLWALWRALPPPPRRRAPPRLWAASSTTAGRPGGRRAREPPARDPAARRGGLGRGRGGPGRRLALAFPA